MWREANGWPASAPHALAPISALTLQRGLSIAAPGSGQNQRLPSTTAVRARSPSGKMSIRHEVRLHSRRCKQFAKDIGMTFGRLRRPCNVACQPRNDLPPRISDRLGTLEYARISDDSQESEQTCPRQSHLGIAAELLVKPAFCDVMLTKRRHVGVDEDVGVDQDHLHDHLQDHLNASPSLIESTSAMLSRLPILTRPRISRLPCEFAPVLRPLLHILEPATQRLVDQITQPDAA